MPYDPITGEPLPETDAASDAPRATFIAPDHYGPVMITPGMTIEQALEEIGQDADAVVKLNGTQAPLSHLVQADAVYLVVPGSVAKGNFDAGSN